MGVALLAAAFWLPSVGVVLLLVAVCGFGTWEFYRMLDVAKLPHFKMVGVLAGMMLIAATWWSLFSSNGQSANGEWLVLSLAVSAIFVRQFSQKDNPRPLETIAVTLLGLMYVPFLFNFFTKLLMTWGEADGRLLLLYLIAVTKCTDIGAYFVGCAIGRHKLVPRISPAKSWEGVFGGIATGVLASLVFIRLAGGFFDSVGLTYRDGLILGVLLAVFGVIGDLAESLVKRAAGVKDSGGLILGMGGLLDLIDSLLFAAPPLYVYVHWFLQP